MRDPFLLEFQWSKPLNGEVVLIASDHPGLPGVRDQFLVHRTGSLTETQGYRPDASKLLKRLSRLPLVPEAFSSLFFEFGWLSRPTELIGHPTENHTVPRENLPAEDSAVDPSSVDFGQSLSMLEISVRELTTVVGLFGEVGTENTRALAQRIQYSPEGYAQLRDAYDGISLRARMVLEGRRRTLPRGGAVGPALDWRVRIRKDQSKPDPCRIGWLLLEKIISQRIEGTVQPLLLSGPDGLRLRISTRTLLDFLWLSLARQVDQGAPPRRCPRDGCGNWFPPNRRCKRGHDTYCCDTCRQADLRRRKKVRGLSETGLKPAQVARRIGCSIAEVRRLLRG